MNKRDTLKGLLEYAREIYPPRERIQPLIRRAYAVGKRRGMKTGAKCREIAGAHAAGEVTGRYFALIEASKLARVHGQPRLAETLRRLANEVENTGGK